MATVVNDRDIQLESISPRVAGVTLAANITVTQDQVDGLGLVLNGTKNITLLSTSQVIQVLTDGSTNPASITLTANVQNLTETPTLTIVPGSGTMSVTPALTAGVFTFTPAQLTSDTITFQISLTDGSDTYTDQMTVMKVYQGSDGLSAILTNEAVTLPSDNLGNVLTYSGAGGAFKVYHGTVDVTNVCTFSIPSGGNPSSLTANINASGSTAGLYIVTAGIPSGTDVVAVTFRATFGTTTIDKVFSIAKAKAGANGTSGGAGANGTRGSVALYVGLGGSTATWSDSTAATAVTSYTGTAPIRLDQVTEYNNSQSFSVTKFFDGTNWQTVNAVINGNLLVTGTVGGNALVANSVDATRIDSRNLTLKDISGNVIFSAGVPIPAGYVALGTNVGGQINSSNVSTFIANATISAAQVGTINANQVSASSLSAITATIGTLRTTSSGARVEISDNVIKVFDSSNVKRVQIGDLSL